MEKLRDKPENIDLEEFVPLVGEWREDNASKAKCPYCVEPIQKQATKCNHCLSEIEWFKFDDLYGPCKAGATEEMKAALVMAKATLHAAIEAKKAEQKAKVQMRITKLEMASCDACKCPLLTSAQLENLEVDDAHYVSVLEANLVCGNGYRCSDCTAKIEKRFGWFVFGVSMLFFLIILWFYV